jgi:hypothetical protein
LSVCVLFLSQFCWLHSRCSFLHFPSNWLITGFKEATCSVFKVLRENRFELKFCSCCSSIFPISRPLPAPWGRNYLRAHCNKKKVNPDGSNGIQGEKGH